jgi:hypothetical protein
MPTSSAFHAGCVVGVEHLAIMELDTVAHPDDVAVRRRRLDGLREAESNATANDLS